MLHQEGNDTELRFVYFALSLKYGFKLTEHYSTNNLLTKPLVSDNKKAIRNQTDGFWQYNKHAINLKPEILPLIHHPIYQPSIQSQK